MKFYCIFSDCKIAGLFSVYYPGDNYNGKKMDAFRKVFLQFTDTEYLRKFFIENKDKLDTDFWGHMDINDAINKVHREILDFSKELKCIELKEDDCEDLTLDDVFEPLHMGEFYLKKGYSEHIKGKPRTKPPMIRLYGLILDDGSYIITGGAIKLTEKMESKELEIEIDKIKEVQQYLKARGISTKEGLFE